VGQNQKRKDKTNLWDRGYSPME